MILTTGLLAFQTIVSIAWADPTSNVQLAGALGNGVHDDAPNIQGVINTHNTVIFPPAAVCYWTMSTLIGHASLHLIADTIPSSGINGGICSGNPTADAISFTGNAARGVVIEGLAIVDRVLATRTAGNAVKLDGTGGAAIFDVRDVFTYGFTNAFDIQGAMDSTINVGHLMVPKQDGIHFHGIVSTSVKIHAYVDSPGGHCYYLSTLNYSQFDSTACDFPTSSAYALVNADGGVPTGITFNSPGGEMLFNSAMVLDGRDITINSPTFSGTPAGFDVIVLNGVTGLTVNSGSIVGGRYGVNGTVGPGHGLGAHTVSFFNTTFSGQAIAPYLDPNNLIKRVNPTTGAWVN